MTTEFEFKEGDTVRIDGERGKTYIVKRRDPLLLYGGSVNPNGRRCYKTVEPDRLRPYKRRRKDAAL